MPLTYLPDREHFFLWGERSFGRTANPLSLEGETEELLVVRAGGRRYVLGIVCPLFRTSARLAVVPAADLPTLGASTATWVLASKLALDLLSRERIVPKVIRRNGKLEARWGAALSAAEDAGKFAAVARSMPPSAHAVPVPGGSVRDVWAPEALLRSFLDSFVDTLVRVSHGGPHEPREQVRPREQTRPLAQTRLRKQTRRVQPGLSSRSNADGANTPWEQRWCSALVGQDSTLAIHGFGERTLAEDLDAWSEPAFGASNRLRACFRLEMPDEHDDAFRLRYLLQSPDDPSLLVTANEVWNAKGRSLARFGRAFRDPQESLLEALGRAARLFAPIAESLHEPRPEALVLSPALAWSFLSEGAPSLSGAGFGVIVPAELTAAGQRRLRLRMRVGNTTKVAGMVNGTAGLGLDELLSVAWEAVLGDTALSTRELALLARQKTPLVRYRGQWVAVDPQELLQIRNRMASGASKMTVGQALVDALSGETLHAGKSAAVLATGTFAVLLDRLRQGGDPGAANLADVPPTFRGTLRPYQARGLAWLSTMAGLGLGGCLADDMGLGKTIQLLAFLLHRVNDDPRDRRPTLLVAPTSVVGNWEREIERFAPSLTVVRHYGTGRARRASRFPQGSGTLVLTSYGLLRRDVILLSKVEWSAVVLDEAQNIKNSASATARAARSLTASHRFALTGTPVENRLAELWSIFEFANPGLLGPLEKFKREYAVPIERFGNDDAALQLKRIVGPFLLRRLKSDPSIIRDLPSKNEMKVICTLTREQASLYRAVVDEEMRRIESADGIERRGRVLALLTFLKQVCNHPAQYLGEREPLAKRSGKLERLAEMLEEAMSEGDKALVFTQYREMGERLAVHLRSRLGVEVLLLHGGTARAARDEMVRRFQDEPYGPRVFVLSVKAGGTGLNLTAANHVFHFDRWWNPAVEDQATDRAYRIGQKRSVQVHKLICAGTMEEKIDRMLEQKRELASKVIGTGEKWITELGNDDLRELLSLVDGAIVGDDEAESGIAESTGTLGRRENKKRRPSVPVRRRSRSDRDATSASSAGERG